VVRYTGGVDITAVTTRADMEVFHDLDAAAYSFDYVGLPADPLSELLPLLESPESAGELARLYVGWQDGVPVCSLSLHYPTLDNLTALMVDVNVHPDHRRKGYGREVVAFVLQEAKANGRTRLFAEVPRWEDKPTLAQALVDEVGAKRVLDDVRRMLDLQKHPAGPRSDVPAGYRIEQWVDRCPEALVDGCAYLMGRMTLDAPMGDMDYEQEKWDAARYRDKEKSSIERSRRRIASAAVHVETGQVAGITDIGVNHDVTETAYQWDTIVDPDHRGHGLGLVLKSWNHAYLVEQVKGVRYVNTWNAASNTFMIKVNEQMGFEPVESWSEYQLDL
jgi:GNAT superfamily N-acetyltransferase